MGERLAETISTGASPAVRARVAAAGRSSIASGLDADPLAAAAFAALQAADRYSIIWHLNDAKRPETRARRLAKFLDMLARPERFH